MSLTLSDDLPGWVRRRTSSYGDDSVALRLVSESESSAVFSPFTVTPSFRLSDRVFRKLAFTFDASVNPLMSIGVAFAVVNHLSPTAVGSAWPKASDPTKVAAASLPW